MIGENGNEKIKRKHKWHSLVYGVVILITGLAKVQWMVATIYQIISDDVNKEII